MTGGFDSLLHSQASPHRLNRTKVIDMEAKPLTLAQMRSMFRSTKKALAKKRAKVAKMEKLRLATHAMIDDLYNLQKRENEISDPFWVPETWRKGE